MLTHLQRSATLPPHTSAPGCFAAWLIRWRNFSLSSTLANLSVCLGFYFWLLEEEGVEAGFSPHRSTVVSCPMGEPHLLIVMLLVRAACLYQDTVFSACLRLYWQSQALSGGIKISIYQDLTTTIKGNGLGNSAPFTPPIKGWDGAALLVFYSICHFKSSVKPTHSCLHLFYFAVSIFSSQKGLKRSNPRPDSEDEHGFVNAFVFYKQLNYCC